MENARLRAWQGMFKSLILFALLALANAGYASSIPEDRCMGPAPANLEIASQSSGAVSFTWDGVGNPDGFKIWYYRSEDNYTSAPVFTENEFISFSSLPSGTYDFFFVAIHGEEVSSYVISVDLIM